MKQSFERRAKRQGLLTEEEQQQHNAFFDRFYGLQFWIENPRVHEILYRKTGGWCCFWHAIKPPKLRGVPRPLWDYQLNIIKQLQAGKHLWIKKAVNTGITELCLRYIVFKALCTSDWDNSNCCIIAGNRIDMAINVISRIKGLFPDIDFKTKETALILGNNVRVSCWPSFHVNAMRGLTDVKFILITEADFFPPGQQIEARHVSERYIGKSQAQIVMESTPNAPNQLYESIEREEPSLYTKVFIPYDLAMDKMFTEQDIAAARQSPSFDREYLLKYVGTQGNLFSYESIQRSVDFGTVSYDPNYTRTDTEKYMGIDAGFSSSNFAFCIAEVAPRYEGIDSEGNKKYDKSSQQVNVVIADELHRPLFQQAIDHIINLVNTRNVDRLYVDDSAPSVIASLKAALGENPQYQEEAEYIKRMNADPEKSWRVIPVSFRREHKALAAHSKKLLDYNNPALIAIHPSLTKLITALRTANFTEFDYQKGSSSFDDIYDAFRLAIRPIDVMVMEPSSPSWQEEQQEPPYRDINKYIDS